MIPDVATQLRALEAELAAEAADHAAGVARTFDLGDGPVTRAEWRTVQTDRLNQLRLACQVAGPQPTGGVLGWLKSFLRGPSSCELTVPPQGGG